MTDKEKAQLEIAVKDSLALMRKTLDKINKRIESIKREDQDMKDFFKKEFAKTES